MRAGVTDIDRGYKALLRDLGMVAKGAPRVFVGILQDQGGERAVDGSITLAGYAAVNEFGSEDGHVPERSFLRSTVDENRGPYAKRLEGAVEALIDGIRSGVPGAGIRRMEESLGQTGLRVSRDVKNKIRDLRDPPNAPSTLARKYPGDNPLIHTGRMRQAISFMVDMSGQGEGTTSAPKRARRARAS